MLTREQLHALLCLKKRNLTFFSTLPRDLIRYMTQTSIDSPDSEIVKLLHDIAYGDLQSAKDMLEVNPRLVLQASHVVTPSGLKVMHTTPLECALGAGDAEMAKMIEPYFDSDKISGGAAVRTKQYARYRTHIENMLDQPPYDFTLLMDTLKQASSAEADAALANDTTYASALSDVLEQFRKDFTPGKIHVGMHFNYQHLLQAFEVYLQNFRFLYRVDNTVKTQIFCCLVIGFIQRSLPAIDRMLYAQGLYTVIDQAAIKRSYLYKTSDLRFPVTAGDDSRSGLGFGYFAAMFGFSRWAGMECEELQKTWKIHLERTLQTCRTYVTAAIKENDVAAIADVSRLGLR
jgi:hypothetical protein